MAKDFAGKWAWRFPQEDLPEGCHDEGCHPCDSTLASFAESPINSGISGANITNNPEGCHADNTGELGNVEAEAISIRCSITDKRPLSDSYTQPVKIIVA